MKNHRKSNAKKILDYIRLHGSITVDIARDDLGVRRASARILDLRNLGHNIITTMRYSKNDKYGVYSIGVKS